jgi:F-type H+-transporting ATPase subunit a
MNGMSLLAVSDPVSHVKDHALYINPNGYWLLSNHIVMLLLSALLMLLIFPLLTNAYRSGKLVPTGSRNFFEAIIMYIRDDVVKPVLGDETDRFMPYLWTLFFFILFNNLLGLLPLDLITGKLLGLGAHGHGIYGTATANFWVTATLAIISFIVIQVSGLRANGPINWAKHFLGGAPWYLAPVMIPVEFLGMLIKPFALAIRLAANMTAGHILLAVIIGFVPMAFAGLGAGGGVAIGIVSVISAVAINCLELFVAFLQAYLFTFLTALFISQMVVHEHEHHEDEGGHHDESHEKIGGGDLTDHSKLPDAARQAGAHMAG